MDTRRFLSSVKAASRTTKAVGICLVALSLAGSLALACSASTDDSNASSNDSLSSERGGRLPYTKGNLLK